MIRKVALKAGVFALLVLVVVNAYFALSHLKQLQRLAALTIESSQIQANVAAVLKDLTDMETGQRGYLLTADDSYLQPYNDAKSKIGAELAMLREQLSTRSDRSVATLSQLESLATSKQDEIERSINLRQQGYRRRAFRLIDSNEGMEYMAQARTLLSSLSAEEAGISRQSTKRERIKGAAFSRRPSPLICSCLRSPHAFSVVSGTSGRLFNRKRHTVGRNWPLVNFS